jgi:hypothetical protein
MAKKKRKPTARQRAEAAHWRLQQFRDLSIEAWADVWGFAPAAKNYADAGFTDPVLAHKWKQECSELIDAAGCFSLHQQGMTPKEGAAYVRQLHPRPMQTR